MPTPALMATLEGRFDLTSPAAPSAAEEASLKGFLAETAGVAIAFVKRFAVLVFPAAERRLGESLDSGLSESSAVAARRLQATRWRVQYTLEAPIGQVATGGTFRYSTSEAWAAGLTNHTLSK